MTTGVAAIVRRFLRVFIGLAAVCLFGVASAPCVSAQISSEGSNGTITQIEFIGNRRIQKATLIARMFSREGDPYNEENIRRDFLALWNTQYFEDIRLEVEDDPARFRAARSSFFTSPSGPSSAASNTRATSPSANPTFSTASKIAKSA